MMRTYRVQRLCPPQVSNIIVSQVKGRDRVLPSCRRLCRIYLSTSFAGEDIVLHRTLQIVIHRCIGAPSAGARWRMLQLSGIVSQGEGRWLSGRRGEWSKSSEKEELKKPPRGKGKEVVFDHVTLTSSRRDGQVY